MHLFPRMLTAAALAASVSTVPAMAETLDFRMNVRVMGFTAMITSLKADYRGGYAAKGAIEPQGMARRMGAYYQYFSTRGKKSGMLLKPSTFTMRVRPGNSPAWQQTVLRWPAGKVPELVKSPGFSRKVFANQRKYTRAGAEDPLTMLLNASNRSGGICAGRFRAFDGFKVYDISLQLIRKTRYSGSHYKGPALLCAVTSRQLAGEPQRNNGRQATYRAWLVPVKSKSIGWLLVPVKVTGRFEGFNFTATVSRFRLGGKGLKDLAAR